MDAQWKRIEAIVGSGETSTFEDQRGAYYEYLLRSLKLPCDVTGIEDFRWEEPYVLGAGSRSEYERLRKDRPSYQDKYDLLAIERRVFSEWMLFREAAAFLRRSERVRNRIQFSRGRSSRGQPLQNVLS